MKLQGAPLTDPPATDAPAGAPTAAGPADALFAALLNLITAQPVPAAGPLPDAPMAPKDGKHTAGATAPAVALAAALPAPAPAPSPAPAATVPADPADPAASAVPAAPEPHAKHPAHGAPAVVALPKLDLPSTEPAKPAPHTPAPVAAPPAQAAKPPVPALTKPAKASEPAPDAATKLDAPKAAAPLKQHEPAHAAGEPRPALRAERIEALVRLATRQGAAEARMELHPQELGSVVVKLRVTNDGLQATFTASNPDSVAQLQQAGDDLRRTLESKGLTLASLDVRAQSSEAGDRREERGWGRAKERRRVEQLDDDLPTVTTSIPVGELVDVQA